MKDLRYILPLINLLLVLVLSTTLVINYNNTNKRIDNIKESIEIEIRKQDEDYVKLLNNRKKSGKISEDEYNRLASYFLKNKREQRQWMYAK